MQVYQTDFDGRFIGAVQADESPLEPGVWLIPGGCVTVAPPQASEGQAAYWVGNAWVLRSPTVDAPASSMPTAIDVERERDRRLAGGFVYKFGDSRGSHLFGTTLADMSGWQEVTTIAQAAISVGQPSTAIEIVTNTGPATVTALEWQQILLAAGQFRQPIWQASLALAAMTPIPADYAADQHWPAAV